MVRSILFLLLAAFGAFFFFRFLVFFSGAPLLAIMPVVTVVYGFSAILWLPLFYWKSESPTISRFEAWLEKSAHVSIGFFSFLLCILILRDFLLFFGFDSLRTPIFTFVVFSIACGTTLLGFFVARSGPVVRKVEMTPALDLPPGFQLKIAQVSDLHVGTWIGKRYVDQVVKKIQAQGQIDFLLLTGDIGDGDPSVHLLDLKPFSEIKPRHGSFYVSGNHEGYWNESAWNNLLRQIGFQVLDNESVTLADAGVRILGTSDPKHDLKKAAEAILSDHENSRILNIYLAHQPHHAEEASRIMGKTSAQKIHVQLSGHTHAGQFIPWSLMIGLFQKYVRGFYRISDLFLYVNVGTGFWGPPVRLGTRSEITLLTVRAKS